jgi:branched-chain amino acid transport system permease protein
MIAGWRRQIPRGLGLAIVAVLAAAPFLLPGVKALDVAAQVCIYILLAASYDILLGYTGIVSFAHTMFFGLGAYAVAIATTRLGESWWAVLVGLLAGLVISGAVAMVIGLFSLRVKAIFFSMITLAVASFFGVLVSQLTPLTGGVDGLPVPVPAILNERVVSYYLVFGVSLGLFYFMIRVVRSPFGRVLQAIRENPFRAEAIGYRTVSYRVLANCLSAMLASVAGALLALWLKYNGPQSTVSLDIMVNVLLMVVIGGMGTLYGAAVGAVVMVLANYYLKTVMAWLSAQAGGVPALQSLFHPDHWLLWLGVLFILCVYFFPRGIVGKLLGPAG